MDELPDEVSAMAGLRRIDSDLDRILGTPAENNRHPNSLRLRFAVPWAPVLRQETILLIENLFVTRMKHMIIVVGEWETESGIQVGGRQRFELFCYDQERDDLLVVRHTRQIPVCLQGKSRSCQHAEEALDTRHQLDAATANAQTRKRTSLLTN